MKTLIVLIGPTGVGKTELACGWQSITKLASFPQTPGNSMPI